ncbi:MAG: ROK family protein [Eubacterium sp.]
MIFTLDIGGTYTKFAHIDNNKIIKKGKWETTDNFQLIIDKIDSVICPDVEYIGISSGGFWDKDGKSIGYETVESTSENNLKKSLSKKYDCPVFIENDARCALLAEKKYGALKDYKNAVMFVLGSSLGCAVMINKELYSGNTNQAGAMFMMPEYYDCDTYRFDKSANSIALTKKYDPSLNMGNMLLLEEKALSNDESALSLIEEYTRAVALKCWYAYLMYDPECIALGGGIAKSKYIVKKIQEHLNSFFKIDKSTRIPLILNAQFQEDSNLIGAALLDNRGHCNM